MSNSIESSIAERQAEIERQLLSRQTEAVKLFRPMPTQLPFYESNARVRILRGGNQSGKSISGFMETASCAIGQPLYRADGSKLPYRYDLSRPRTIWTIGYGEDHVGQTIYRYLFSERHGFKIIKDEVSGIWRAWNPDLEYDKAYKEKSRDAAPLIPERLIKKIAWEDKRRDLFDHVELVDGTRILAFTSGGNPKQGDQVDLIHVDEDIHNPEDVWEWYMRLPKYGGRIIWTVFPHSHNTALLKLHQIAEEDASRDEPAVQEYLLKFRENKYFDEEVRNETLRILLLGGSSVSRARDSGEFTFDTQLVYPSYSPKLHTALVEDLKLRDRIDTVLRERSGEPPADWTRYFVLDPGHSICAGLFLAIPPPDFGDYVIAYDVIYQRQSDADKLAETCATKMSGFVFEDFIIDWHAGRQTSMGASKTVKMLYREAFEKRSLRCQVRGSDFKWGSDNVSGRLGQVRKWLAVSPTGLPKLRLVTSRTNDMQQEFLLYKMKILSGEIADEPIPQNNHLMNCLEYAAAAELKYVKPKSGTGGLISEAYKAFMRMRHADVTRKAGGKSDHINLGAGAV